MNPQVGILIDFMGFMECIAYVRATWKEECCQSFVWRRIYVCQIYALKEKKRGR